MRPSREAAEAAEMIDIDERLAPYFEPPVPEVTEVTAPADAAALMPPAAQPRPAPSSTAGTRRERADAQSPAR